MGIGSITPRIDYSQGNEFYNELKTLDDIHKPALDGIGYQDSLTGKEHGGMTNIKTQRADYNHPQEKQ